MSNGNLITSFLALQDNIILQQNDLLQQNRDISKKLLEMSKIDLLVKKNEQLTSQVSVAQNGWKFCKKLSILQVANSWSLKENINWNSIWGGNAWTFSGIPTSVKSKDLENFIPCLLQEIGIDLDKSRIVACYRLGKTDRTIVKFLNRKDAENVYLKKRELKDVDISCLLSRGLSRKRKIFISQNLCQ